MLILLKKHQQAVAVGYEFKAAAAEGRIDLFEGTEVYYTLIVARREQRAKVDKLDAAKERANTAWGKASRTQKSRVAALIGLPFVGPKSTR